MVFDRRWPKAFTEEPAILTMVGLVGFEPTTPALSRRCSNQLSYRPRIRLRAGHAHTVLAGPAQHHHCLRSRRLRGCLWPFVPQHPSNRRLNRLCRTCACSLYTADRCGRLRPRANHTGTHALSSILKGGDPAAPSDTATLLRLHPSHEPYRGKRPPCG